MEVVIRDGNVLTMNTLSTLALRRAGIAVKDWFVRDVTGFPEAENALTERLLKNNLGNEGTPVLRITGLGKKASSLQ